MLSKLVKYDFKWINKVMYIYFIILFPLTIVVKIVESLDKTFWIVILDKIVSGVFIAIAINIIVTCFIRVWVRFIHNIYKDESYLTHTLPVTKNELFNSKIISSILSIILSILVVLICFAIINLNSTTIDSIKFMIDSLVHIYGRGNAIFLLISFGVLILLEILYLMQAGIFGIVVGYKSNNHKLISSILIGIGSYSFLSIISLIVIRIVSSLFHFEIVAEGFPSLGTIRTMVLTFMILYLIYNILYYFISKYLLNKGVNVE